MDSFFPRRLQVVPCLYKFKIQEIHSAGSGVAAIAVDPSLTDTAITRHMSMMKSVSRYFVYPLFWPFMKTAKLGGQTLVQAALDPALADCSGDYFV